MKSPADTSKSGSAKLGSAKQSSANIGEVHSSIELSDEQRLNWLRLIRSQNVGPATFRDLINHFRTAAAALEALPDLVARGTKAAGGRKIKICSREDAEAEIELAKLNNARFIGMGEPHYPLALRRVDHPPPIICVKGNSKILTKPAVSIVGSRNASVGGMRLAGEFAANIGSAGYLIVSGLARGIDASAHQYSLTTGTAAVFAGGVNKLFPPENEELAYDILENGGAFVSEMPMGWQPRGKDFPRRNRLVAGMALGLVVVEAAKRSGSLISARLANEAGRQVFAVPGSPLDPRAAGANWLIRQGATLATSPDDVIDELREISELPDDPAGFIKEDEGSTDGFDTPDEAMRQLPDDNLRQSVINALDPSPVETDDIIRFCHASPAMVQLVLLELDLAGQLERHGGNRVSLTK